MLRISPNIENKRRKKNLIHIHKKAAGAQFLGTLHAATGCRRKRVTSILSRTTTAAWMCRRLMIREHKSCTGPRSINGRQTLFFQRAPFNQFNRISTESFERNDGRSARRDVNATSDAASSCPIRHFYPIRIHTHMRMTFWGLHAFTAALH